MTIDEFLDKFKACAQGVEWVIDDAGCLRTKEFRSIHCPLTFLCREEGGPQWPVWDADCAGRSLGLPAADINKIIGAADHISRSQYALRSKLLEALGLDEQPTVPQKEQ